MLASLDFPSRSIATSEGYRLHFGRFRVSLGKML